MKKMPLRWFMGLLCLLITMDLYSQEVKRLVPGDVFPKELLVKLIKENGYNIPEDSIRNKFIILDFWNIWCPPCIKGMPRMNELQKIFKKDLLIVEVTRNNKKEVEGLFKRIGYNDNKLISLKSDSILHQYFQTNIFPSHVWIDNGGIVRYITSGHNATNHYVASFIKGNSLPLFQRVSNGNDNSFKTYIEQIGLGRQDHVGGYSLLMKGRIAKSDLLYVSTANPKLFKPGLGYYKNTLAELYLGAYSKEIYGKDISTISSNYYPIIVEVKDKSLFFRPEDSNQIDLWEVDHLYSYESYYPMREDELYKIFREDLDRYFGYSVEIKPNNTRFFILKRTGKAKNSKHANITAWDIYSHLKSILNWEFFEFKYEGKWIEELSIDNAAFGRSVDDLKTILKHHGYELVEEWRLRNWLIIRDRLKKR